VHQRTDARAWFWLWVTAHPCYSASMHIVVLHTPKGGSGKSTLARELVVAANRAGVRVAMADLDPQGTATGWYQRRKAEAPALRRRRTDVPCRDGPAGAAPESDEIIPAAPPRTEVEVMLPAERRHRRRLRLRRIKVALVWVIVGVAIGAPVALSVIRMEHRHPVTAPAD
jgi:cellulose biosynthesis protein BcsQ